METFNLIIISFLLLKVHFTLKTPKFRMEFLTNDMFSEIYNFLINILCKI
jgi:hypothetical protein